MTLKLVTYNKNSKDINLQVGASLTEKSIEAPTVNTNGRYNFSNISVEKEIYDVYKELKTVSTYSLSEFYNKDLAIKANITAEQLDAIIDYQANRQSTPSVMRGMGQSIIDAANASGLDPLYLLAHAGWETGWGTSDIIKDKFNWFGINAVDSDPYASAYEFDNKFDGFIEGAKWIRRNYYDRGQTTISSMVADASHRYASANEEWRDGVASCMLTGLSIIQYGTPKWPNYKDTPIPEEIYKDGSSNSQNSTSKEPDESQSTENSTKDSEKPDESQSTENSTKDSEKPDESQSTEKSTKDPEKPDESQTNEKTNKTTNDSNSSFEAEIENVTKTTKSGGGGGGNGSASNSNSSDNDYFNNSQKVNNVSSNTENILWPSNEMTKELPSLQFGSNGIINFDSSNSFSYQVSNVSNGEFQGYMSSLLAKGYERINNSFEFKKNNFMTHLVYDGSKMIINIFKV